MPRLTEKFRAMRRLNRPHSREEADERSKNKHWFWGCIALAVIVVLGAYFWKTSAKILGEPITIEYGPADPPFPSAMGPIVGAEFTGGNSVELLVNGDAFFPSMLEAIREAKKTITLETYIWSPGKVSDDFIAALTERARAGVNVHVLIDGMGTLKFTDEDRERLREAGVEIYKYGRQHWWEVKPNINHRTHRKILVVDGRIGFTGGMCIDDRWAGNADNENVWRETQVRIEGPAVRQMQAAFASNWLQTTSGLLLGEGYYPKIEAAGTMLAHCFNSGPDEGPEIARLSYLFAIAAARKSIDLSHGYFVPDDLAIDMLVAARKRGVKVRIIVPAINDSRFGRAASRSRWGPLLEAGIEFYRYMPAMFHAKTMAVDDVLVTIGSANFDNRSFSINDEVTANILDRRIGAEYKRIFETDLKRSERYTLEDFESRAFHVKAVDRIAGLFRSQF